MFHTCAPNVWIERIQSIHHGSTALFKRAHRGDAVSSHVTRAGSPRARPLSLPYFLKVTDLDLATIGLLVSVTTALTLPAPIVVGRLADRFGPRLVVADGQALQGLGSLLYLTVSGAGSLVAAVLVTMVGSRVYWSSIFTLIADHTDRADAGSAEAKDHWYARTGMIREAGAGGQALLASAMLAFDSTGVYDELILGSALAFLAAALMVVLAVPALPHAPPPADRPSGHRALLRDRPYLALIGTCMIFALCSTFLALSLPVYVVQGLSSPDWVPGPLQGRAGLAEGGRSGCRPPTTAPTGSPISMGATPSARTRCGGSTGAARASTAPGPP
ncbi:MFS family permease [Streptosporangium brasiliense]|uniref:MFS family permease n=1 Tax=Streptosporangium brasiliense TaxID=47480 RepID=A0ABT9RHD9_9ACTN|nr:MFS family permease [Streptosporangium brasiliense]